MKLFKKLSIFIFIIIVFNLFVALPVSAAVVGNLEKLSTNKEAYTYINPAGKGPVENVEGVVVILITILKWTYSIFFIVAVFMILMAAYTYLTAQAEPEKIKNATNQIVWASIAIAVALLAVSISMIVKSIVSPSGGGGTGVESSTYPVNGGQGFSIPASDARSVNTPPGVKIRTY